MDVTILSQNTLRIKSRNATLIVDPTTSTAKTETDAIIFLEGVLGDKLPKIIGSRITIKGPGEYEVGGVKISVTSVGNDLIASADVDSVKVLLGSGKAIEKVHDKIEQCEVVVVKSDDEFNYSLITTLEPKAVVVYGEKKDEVAKSLGKNDALKSNKFSATAEKLPEEMQLVLLG